MAKTEERSQLVRAQEEVGADLSSCLTRAQELLDRIPQVKSRDSYEDLKEDHRAFEERVWAILKHSFTTTHEFSDFNIASNPPAPMRGGIGQPAPNVGQLLEEMRKELRGAVRNLDGLRERLHLYKLQIEKGATVSTPQQYPSVHQTFNAPVGGLHLGVGEQNVFMNTLNTIVEQLDRGAGTPGEKAEAKGRLRLFLEHPIVGRVLGETASVLIRRLGE